MQSKVVDGANLKVSFKQEGTAITGTGNYDYNISHAFGKFLGRSSSKISGTVSASRTTDKFIDLVFLIDNSASMGIAATQADQKRAYDAFYNSTYKLGCTFSCHVAKNDFEKELTPEKFADIGITTRMDIIKESLEAAITKIDNETQSGRVRVGIYTFSNSLTQLIAPTTNLENVKRHIEDDLSIAKIIPDGPTHIGGTYLRTALLGLEKQLARDIGKSKDGSSKSNRKSYVLMMSDGIENNESFYEDGTFFDGETKFEVSRDLRKDWDTESNALELSYGLILQPFNPESCAALKKNKRDIYTAQIRYTRSYKVEEVPTNGWKSDYIESMAGVLDNAFAECASSPSNHVIAEDSTEISKSFEMIIESINSTEDLRITR